MSNRLVNDLKFSHTWFDAGSKLAPQRQELRPPSGASGTMRWGPAHRASSSIQPAAGPSSLAAPASNIRFNKNLYLKDLLSLVVGKHTLTLGGDLKYQKYDWNFEAAGNGGTYWMGLNDGGSLQIAGSAFADVLMAVPTQIAFQPERRHALLPAPLYDRRLRAGRLEGLAAGSP